MSHYLTENMPVNLFGRPPSGPNLFLQIPTDLNFEIVQLTFGNFHRCFSCNKVFTSQYFQNIHSGDTTAACFYCHHDMYDEWRVIQIADRGMSMIKQVTAMPWIELKTQWDLHLPEEVGAMSTSVPAPLFMKTMHKYVENLILVKEMYKWPDAIMPGWFLKVLEDYYKEQAAKERWDNVKFMCDMVESWDPVIIAQWESDSDEESVKEEKEDKEESV